MVDNIKARAKEILSYAKGKEIAVIGDVMLDRYFWGSVSRISPEAPVPVIDVENETFHLGGAANVAKNLKSLGLNPLLCGVLGNDNSGKRFVQIAEESGLSPDGIYFDPNRPTTVKTRIIGNNQQIARLDREVRDDIGIDGKRHMIETLEKRDSLAGIIFEDYNKGTITSTIIKEVIDFSKKKNIPVFVDPKSHNFFDYKGVTVFKPNKKEAQQALGINIRDKDDVRMAGSKLLEMLNCQNVLITLGAAGMMLFESDGSVSSVSARARSVADVSGAGDTAIATLAASMSGGANFREAATIANYASGIVVEQPGIVSIRADELLESINGG